MSSRSACNSGRRLKPLKIAIVAAEITPSAKVGGLADVIGSLPGALKRAGAEPVVIVPGYAPLMSQIDSREVGTAMRVNLAGERHDFEVFRAQDARGVPLFLIDHPGFFGRSGIYGEGGIDYADNLRRFVFFGKAATAAIAEFVQPDIVNAHDWHSAVVPIVMRGDASLRDRFRQTTAAFTIHNMAFQGIFDAVEFPLLGIDPALLSIDVLEFYGRMNLMKGALALSDGSSTVSPTYAHEVASEAGLGFGLEGVIRRMGDRFVGILNGADYEEWNPATDTLIASTYGAQNPSGKQNCARMLRSMLELPQNQDRPIIGIVSRMTPQKGFDLLRDALDDLMRLDFQLVMLANGDPVFEQFFTAAIGRYPDQLRVITDFDNVMAHRIQAGSDAFLMPSRFEPCGLTQMYALKYGTAPIVRATGGLRDTIEEFDPAAGTGNGFVLHEYRVDTLIAAVQRMMSTFANKEAWHRLMQNCFAADFSWDRAARSYLEWFARLHTERKAA